MNGWLSPSGKFYPCKINEHIQKMRELVKAENPELFAEKTHWLKITPYHIFAGVHNDFQNDKEDLTQPQIDFLWTIVADDDCFNDLREMANWILTGNYKIN